MIKIPINITSDDDKMRYLMRTEELIRLSLNSLVDTPDYGVFYYDKYIPLSEDIQQQMSTLKTSVGRAINDKGIVENDALSAHDIQKKEILNSTMYDADIIRENPDIGLS